MRPVDPAVRSDRLHVAGLDLEVARRGDGPPLLMLHGMQSPDPRHAYLDHIARGCTLIAPSHPGFGDSPRPDGFETVYDLVHLYIALIDGLEADKVSLMGLSFGGWIAAEIATLRPARLDKLILVDTFGIKISDRTTPDILDVFNTHPREVQAATWHDAETWAPRHDELTDEELQRVARDWDALCLYGWSPYMHNPRLKRWLPHVAAPTLVLWGESDRIARADYGRAFAGLIPDARFHTISRAGHRPEIEQPAAFAGEVLGFLQSKS